MSSRLNKAGRDENDDKPSEPTSLPGTTSGLSAAARSDVWEALAALSEADRAVLMLHEFYRLSNAEIARRLSLPRGRSAKRVLRAQIHFHEQLATISGTASLPPSPPARPRPVASTAASQGSKGLGRLVLGVAAAITAKFALAAAALALATVVVVNIIAPAANPPRNASTPNEPAGAAPGSAGETNRQEWTADAGGAGEIEVVIPLSLTTISSNPATVQLQTTGIPGIPGGIPTRLPTSPSVPPTAEPIPTSIPSSPTLIPSSPTPIPSTPAAAPRVPSSVMNSVSTLAVDTTSLPAGQVGVPYSQTLLAVGGTGSYRWSIVAGSLPDGLDLNPATGLLSGTPVSAQMSAFTVRVVDSGSHSAIQPLAIAVIPSATPAPPQLAAQGLCNAVVRGSVEGRDHKQSSTAFEQLGTAATGAGQSIADFCATLSVQTNLSAPPIPPGPHIPEANAGVDAPGDGRGRQLPSAK